ncbi:UDP-3-O-[3-hydroxymyristoyl] N-acetylglucosamine deacetylase [Saprolegnia parasitica CBS 223.65]|uniref:UDP-3-O-acyl-N-acetylglucosamine deacetylase n=1 Tax=Saprolegnia parasitica (strain CBS 223.65) TaxID=695850 RepID=A0A067CED7_SAPPC|nr:UDP-3-O-[3-hydroxymyristoyl] N-acetylglucosamine deacetylase [Saprolegnia parasitica CBS 223.65]KDO28858.1 UDP-3-O-[3-hydroxymyristoyl] N-acetylglucosamine deacetylase [Saprolegnia parasitica CBS 223.65]|eukprot:XP_012200403.1 UDP-3-O-[3-hydroxymyristoyl] N-acetylglucosamine deacetylase [Saprolegnia parasitica CBS 223.65]
MQQRTLRRAIRLSGTGLHLGEMAKIVLHPAPAHTGIRFQDAVAPTKAVAATYKHVQRDTLGFCTRLHDASSGYAIATVEHVLAALSAARIHNCIVETSGPELPVFDGSSQPILAAIAAVGPEEQAALQPFIEVLRPVSVVHKDKAAHLVPRPLASAPELVVSVEVDFRHKGLPRNWLSVPLDEFDAIASARTFTFRDDIAQLQKMDLARGGSLDNAVVFDEGTPLNPDGLRHPIEWVQHKALDCFGDLALAGMPLHGHYTGICPGHALTHELLLALFASSDNYRVVVHKDN